MSARTTNTTNTRTTAKPRRAKLTGARRKHSAFTPNQSTARMCEQSTPPRKNRSSSARRGDGPAFLLCNTYRFHGHHVGDIDRAYYRSKKEEEEWKTQRDPVKVFAQWLSKSKLAGGHLLDRIENEVAAEIKQAVTFALAAPYP